MTTIEDDASSMRWSLSISDIKYHTLGIRYKIFVIIFYTTYLEEKLTSTSTPTADYNFDYRLSIKKCAAVLATNVLEDWDIFI